MLVSPTCLIQFLLNSLRYISPENLPVEYGGLKRDNDVEFFPEDKASELIVRANSAGCINIPVAEVLIWLISFTFQCFNLVYRVKKQKTTEIQFTVVAHFIIANFV